MSVAPITKKSFNGGEWMPAMWSRSDIENFSSGNKTVLNFVPQVHGGASNRPGLHFVAETKTSAKKSRVVPFIFSVLQAYMLEFGEGYVRFYKDDGQIQDPPGTPVEVATPYIEADLALLKFEQSADVLFITHPSYAPRTLSRTSDVTWTLGIIAFAPTQAPVTSLAATAPGTVYKYSVTAVSADEVESVAATPVAGTRGSSVLTWTAPANAAYYNIYEQENGTYFYIGRADTNTYTVPTTPSREPDFSPPLNPGLFESANNYPGVSAFYDQRLIFARTNLKPQTLFGSVVGDFTNMNYSSPVQDDDAFQFTINSRQVNEIRWIVALAQCLIGTSGGEWRMQPGSGSPTITPTSVDLKPQSYYGVAHTRPIVLGNSIVFVDRSNKAVRTLAYTLAEDAYNGNEISILAQHLFEDYGIIDFSYQQVPDSVIWGVLEDGTLVGITYYPEHKVQGWHRHQTDGLFESVSTIPLPDGKTETWFIINRTINGVTKRYVERFDSRSFHTIEEAFFVDSGLSYVGSPATVISGLDHLEGKTVTILADGNVINNKVVSDGALTLPVPASTVHIGLPYTCDIWTLDLDTQTQTGEVSVKTRNVTWATLTFKKTRQAFVGPSSDKLTEIKFRTNENYGEATRLFTGEKKNIAVPPGNGQNSSVFIRVVDPVPCTILSLTAGVQYGDR